jgi:hypothetical protein
MARVAITKKDGTETPYFWLDQETDRTCVRVYKQTPDGLKRAKTLRFNAVKRKFIRD